jgi:DNA processing protein
VIVSNFSPGSGTIHTLNYAHRYQKPIYSIPVIHDQSQAGFEYIRKRQIDFQIIDNTELTALITNY